MGNCPSESVFCPFYHSWWTDPWHMLLPMGANPDTVTFSGFSGGGQMSMQMSIAYSATVKGAAMLQGENYGQDILFDYDGTKDLAITLAEQAQAEGSIDDLSNIKGRPYMVISGRQIEGVDTTDVQTLEHEFYLKYGGNSTLVNDDYVHVWPVDYPVSDLFPEVPCDDFASSFKGFAGAVNCKDDYAGKILKHLLEGAIPDFELKERDLDWRSKGVLRKYGQREFMDENTIFWWYQLADYGYIYYPDSCLEPDAKCHLHFHLHGCMGTAQAWGDAGLRYMGILEYAVTNDLIVVFPQNMYNSINFLGCWSTAEAYWLDSNFYNRDGIQNKALYNMIQKLTLPRDESGDYLANNIANTEAVFGYDFLATVWLYFTNWTWFTFIAGPLLGMGYLSQL